MHAEPATATPPNPTILVVEDEVMLRIVAAEVLSDAGFQVKQVGDGAAALEILEACEGIVLVLSDIKMPGLNGYQLVEAGMSLKPHLKFLLMTGYSQDPLPPLLSKAGVQVLYKPFDFEALPSIVRTMLESE